MTTTADSGPGSLRAVLLEANECLGENTVAFDLPAGDWREIAVELPSPGPLGVVRLYLPAGERPVELDWIELRAKAAGAKPERWDFNGD